MDAKIIQGQCILAGGTVTYTGTLSLGISAYVDKGIYLLKVNATNTTTAPTINLNGLGAKTVFAKDGSALAVGAMLINEIDFFVYVAADNGFRLVTPAIVLAALAWLLNGNTVGAIKTIGTLDDFDIPFITNNVERMRIQGTSSGANVLIGSAFNVALFVGSIQSIVLSPQIFCNGQFVVSDGSSKGILMGYNGNDIQGRSGATLNANNDLVLNGYNNGNVAIGHFSPTARLHVHADDNTSATYSFKAENSSSVLFFSVRNDGVVFVNCSLRINSAQTVISGATSGDATFSQPQSGATYKEVIIYCNALLGATTAYTFPVAFINTPSIVATNDVAVGVVTTLSNTQVIVTGAATSGFIKLIGF